MTRHRLDFDVRQDPQFFVFYGWDAPLGYWAELHARGQHLPVAAYSALEPGYRHDRPLLGVLAWLAEVGTFSAGALEEAMEAWGSTERVRPSRDARRALRVIETLEGEAD